MTNILALTVLGAVILSACKESTKKEQSDDGQSFLKYDTAKIAIISWGKNSRYPFDSTNHKAAALTQEDLRKLDSLFVVCVREYNNALTEAHKEYRIDPKLNHYKKQLIVATNSRGEKVLWVNCFCTEWNKTWRTEVLSLEDGGPCYFNFKINLRTNTIYDLAVNGFA